MVYKRSLTVVLGLLAAAALMGLLLFSATPGGAAGNSFIQTNLRSDNGVPGTKPDARLLNAWGMAFFSGGPFWVNDQGSGVSELIDGKGNIIAGLPFVTILPAAGSLGPSRPTGLVTNSTSHFLLANHHPAFFIFDTLDGTIAAWNSGTTAAVVVNNSTTAQYTGLATAMIGTNPFLYAANSAGKVDVFDGNFKPFKTTGGFNDTHLPGGLTPFGIANIDGNLFVAYAERFTAGGVVDEFTPQGVLVRRFATDGTLNQPWAVVMAPQNFGIFANDLLIGNFGNGTINAFNPKTGTFLGQLHNTKGVPIAISGLWALVPGEGADGVTDARTLYFTAGPNGQEDGLFGFILPSGPAPTPTHTKRPTPTPTKRRTPTPTKKRPTPTPTKRRPTPTRTRTPDPTPTPYIFPY